MTFILLVYASRTEWHALVSKDFRESFLIIRKNYLFTRNIHYSYFCSYLNEYINAHNLSTLTYRRNQTVGKGGSGSAFSSFFGVYHLLRLQCRDIRQQ